MGHFHGRRRHRLNEFETPVVMSLLHRRLAELAEECVDLEQAEELWHVLCRFEINQRGRPSYPEFGWAMLDNWLKAYGDTSE